MHAVTQAIETNRIAETNLVEVAYKSPDPRWASTFVNDLLSKHMERIGHLDEQNDTHLFFQHQRDLVSQRLGTARAALDRYRQEQGGSYVEGSEADLKKAQVELEAERSVAQTALAEAQARVGFLSREIGHHPDTIAAESETRENETVRVLESRLVQLQVQRSELLSKYAPTSTAISDLDRQIAEAQRLITGKQADVKSGSKMAVNPAHQAMEIDMLQKQAEVAALQARLSGIATRQARIQSQLSHMAAAGPELDRLNNEVKGANDAYLDYLRRAEEARLSKALDQSGIVNIAILEKAQVPDAPEPSKATLLLLLGILASLAAGSGLALLRDRLDPAVTSTHHAEHMSGIPVIAEVPR